MPIDLKRLWDVIGTRLRLYGIVETRRDTITVFYRRMTEVERLAAPVLIESKSRWS